MTKIAQDLGGTPYQNEIKQRVGVMGSGMN